MKINKKIIILMILILVTFICAACTVPSSIKEIDRTKYHEISVDRSITEDLKVLDNDLKDKEIIFTAEFHGMKANMELELKFLKYLKEKTNFKYYLCELSYAQGLKLNEFLETGDTAILDELFSQYKGTFTYTKDSYNRWIELYEYNKNFDDDNKIKVIGVDVEHQILYAAKVLKELLPSNEPPKEIKDSINSLKYYVGSEDSIKSIHEDLLARESLYKDYFGENYFNIELIVRNIKNVYYVKEKDSLFNARRDAVMYENFMDIYNTIEDGIFYGQWGHNHTYQSEESGLKWFATYLNEAKFKDKILTIAYTYDNCKFMNKTGNGGYNIKDFDTFSGYTLENGDEQTAILFDIKDSSSVFHENAKYYQYILIISDSEATVPFNE